MSAPTASNELNDYDIATVAAGDHIIFSDSSDGNLIKRDEASNIQTPWFGNIDAAAFGLNDVSFIGSNGTVIPPTGFIRMATNEGIFTRNNANNGNQSIKFNSSDEFEIAASNLTVDYTFSQTVFDVLGNSIEALLQIQDSSQNEQLTFSSIGSAVNQFNIINSITNVGPTITATGDSTNVDFNISTKAAGVINLLSDTTINGNLTFNNQGAGTDPVLSSNAADQTLLLTGNLDMDGQILDINDGTNRLIINAETGVVNWLTNTNDFASFRVLNAIFSTAIGTVSSESLKLRAPVLGNADPNITMVANLTTLETDTTMNGNNLNSVGVITSNTTPIADASSLRFIQMGNNEGFGWRNSTNDGNLDFRVSSLDEFLFTGNTGQSIRIDPLNGKIFSDSVNLILGRETTDNIVLAAALTTINTDSTINGNLGLIHSGIPSEIDLIRQVEVAGQEIGTLDFFGGADIYGNISVESTVITGGSEQGDMIFRTIAGSAQTDMITLTGGTSAATSSITLERDTTINGTLDVVESADIVNINLQRTTELLATEIGTIDFLGGADIYGNISVESTVITGGSEQGTAIFRVASGSSGLTDMISLVGGTSSFFSEISILRTLNMNANFMKDLEIMLDINDNEQLVFGSLTDAVNHFRIVNSPTGTGPTISATGDDTNVDFNITAETDGFINLLSNVDMISNNMRALTQIEDTNGNEQLTFSSTGSAVNQFNIINSITNVGPTITATGDSTNVDFNISTKAAGEINMNAITSFQDDINVNSQDLLNVPLISFTTAAGNTKFLFTTGTMSLGSATTLFMNSNDLVQTGIVNLERTDVTIASDAITATRSFHRLAGQSGVADTLDTITAGIIGDILILTIVSDTITVTETGNIKLSSTPFVMDNVQDTLTLISDGTNWLQITRSNNGG